MLRTARPPAALLELTAGAGLAGCEAALRDVPRRSLDALQCTMATHAAQGRLAAVAAVQLADPPGGSSLLEVSVLDRPGCPAAGPVDGLGAGAVVDQALFRR